MKELVVACCRVAQKNPNLIIDEQSKEYWRWRDTILHNEDLLLEALCFDLSLEPPYKTLFHFLNFFREQDNKKLRNAGWAFVNDSNMTMLCLLFPSRTIAAAALYCAAKHCNVAFADDERGRPWWDVIGVSMRDIRRACNHMAAVYENNPSKHSDNVYSRTPEDGDLTEARTRMRGTRPPRSPDLHAAVGKEDGTVEAEGEKRGEKRIRKEDGTSSTGIVESKVNGNGTTQRGENGDAVPSGQHDTMDGAAERESRRPRPAEHITNGSTAAAPSSSHHAPPSSASRAPPTSDRPSNQGNAAPTTNGNGPTTASKQDTGQTGEDGSLSEEGELEE